MLAPASPAGQCQPSMLTGPHDRHQRLHPHSPDYRHHTLLSQHRPVQWPSVGPPASAHSSSRRPGSVQCLSETHLACAPTTSTYSCWASSPRRARSINANRRRPLYDDVLPIVHVEGALDDGPQHLLFTHAGPSIQPSSFRQLTTAPTYPP